MGKLRERANILGGEIIGANLIGTNAFLADQTEAHPPSRYRALAVAQQRAFKDETQVARTLVGAPGTSVTGELRTRSPVDAAQPVVQRYSADDGQWRRRSTSEAAWSGWVKQFDQENKPAAADVTGLGTAAVQNIGYENGAVPLLSGTNYWTGFQSFLQGFLVAYAKQARFGGPIVLTSSGQATISSGSLELPSFTLVTVIGEGSTDDELINISTTGISSGTLVILRCGEQNITVRHGIGNIRCGSDFALNANSADLTLLMFSGSTWNCVSKQANGS